jgi:hypothetical protein
MAEIRPERRKPRPEISDDDVRKLIRKVNSDLENLERAAQELERVTRRPPHQPH